MNDYSFWHILLFFCLVFGALWLDLRAHKKDAAVSVKNAAMWSGFWVALSLCFCVYVGLSHGWEDASLFLTGYLLEQSLSVDNLFVIMAIFSSFCIKDEFQHRVLYYGILGAIVMRLLFVAAGTSLISLFGPYALGFFGAFVLWSAWKMWQSMEGDNEELEDYTRHWSVHFTQRFMPVHPHLCGHDFFVRAGGRRHATPLFLCLICVEFADVMFAFDSVPAIIAITQKPFLIYTSNIFAILGLRSMYFMLSAAKRALRHLEKAVIAILAFIGVKMLVDVFGVAHVPPFVSLLVVGGLLTGGIVASLLHPHPAPLPVGEACPVEECPSDGGNREAPLDGKTQHGL